MGSFLLMTPGFRFHPTDVELVKYYLRRKILGRKFKNQAITEIDIYKYAPWDLPDKSFLKSRDLKWYFFCPIEKKYACGARINRATESGYWKTTGKDRSVMFNDEVVGMIKTLIFHSGRAPKGDRTNWVMHEYRLEDKNLSDIKDLYVVCKVFKKEGPGPRNGAQYGAPFREEEWTDDEEESHVEQVRPSEPNSLMPSSSKVPQRNFIGSSSVSCVSVLPLQPVSSTDVGLNNTVAPISWAIGSSSRMSDVVDFSCNLTQPVPYTDVEVEKLPILNNDDILSLLYKSGDGCHFTEDENVENKVVNNVDQHYPQGPHFDGTNLFEGLDDLGMFNGLGMDGIDISNAYNTRPAVDEMFSDDGLFLELRDLILPPGIDCNNDANLGSSSYQVNNGVDEVESYSALPGGAFGLEDHLFDPCTAAQNHSDSTQPEPVYHHVNPDTFSGSQNLWDIPK